MKPSWFRRRRIARGLTVIAAGILPLTMSPAAAYARGRVHGSGFLEAQGAFDSNVTSNIYTRKGRSLRAINSNEKRIWEAITQGHLRRARALIDKTASEFPGWHPRAAMTFVLLEKSIWIHIGAGRLQAARRQIDDLRAHYGQGALASATRSAIAAMRVVMKNDELWGLLGHGHLYAAQRAIRRMEAADPGYQPPHKLLATLNEDLGRRALGRYEKAHDWAQVVILYHHEPAIFDRAHAGNRLVLARAFAATGHLGRARTAFSVLLRDAKHLGQAETLLGLAATHLTVADMQALYARAQARFPRDWRALRAAHLRYLLMKAARAHAAHHDRRALALVATQGPAIMALHAAADARLMGALYGAEGHRREALRWWLRAADWSGETRDWRVVGTLALADHNAALMATAITRLPPGTKERLRLRRQADFVDALSAYRHGRYVATLKILRDARRLGPLSAGMRAIEAWSLVHTDRFRRAGVLFTALYRAHPTSGNAAGLIIADQHLHEFAAAYHLAATLKGPLAARLPMATMGHHLADINEMPWRFVAPDDIAAPSPRQSYLAVGGSWGQRGGHSSGLAAMRVYQPSLQAQLGINWHLTAFAQVSSPLIEDGQPAYGQLPMMAATGGAAPAAAHTIARIQEHPGFLLGIDDRRPHAHWRMALGWTSPSIERRGTPQGLLRYTAIPSRNGSRFGFHVLRDRVRQTLISYNGMRETLDTMVGGATVPVSATWGAVMRNQVGASGYASGGRHGWSYIGTLHLNALDGDNIRTNYGATTYLAMMRPVFTNHRWWVTLGPSLYAEGYRRNEDFVSPGYGAYFSPQWMGQPSLSASASHWWPGGAINVSTALGYQWFYETGGPYIGSPSLQRALAPQWAASGLVAAPYGGTRGHNVAGSVDVNLTQRIAGSWYVDTGASYQASPAFQELEAGLDIRDVFGGEGGRTFIPAQYVADMGRYE
ncbi:hypothetical protein C4901_13490 [Acidiferrobacter sp. SPIII_3]|jgi:hypothetical protein|uniref:cellulose synthase subunit BcsC-related outer membrane protein n=1 Tax=Acidiferrobacter sp. SPIII_3 TaxID=1281578 RepID=UPI000D738D1C|nr:cellulose synthase subunit BcsC-related outer membrane protein [Acidiferrobacter sp. SPIII_3]AWP24211.1 hypothetical protein C4901_13490 [Acidiferrobacter sp. SPIII_3]